jgi:hypothetical protein
MAVPSDSPGQAPEKRRSKWRRPTDRVAGLDGTGLFPDSSASTVRMRTLENAPRRCRR